MEIIVTHENADCDAFASVVGAGLLYPGARLVLQRKVSPRVRDYLALHKDHWPIERYDRVDQSAVTRMVVVDVAATQPAA